MILLRHFARICARLCAALVLVGFAFGDAHARVYLVGIDGGSWNVIDELAEAGLLPNLGEIIRRGVHAELETVEPVISPVVWAAISTGRSPKANGIGDFYGTRLRMKVPTVFERLSAGGLHVGLYDFLMTWPPFILPGGFVIPGWLRRDDSTMPPRVWERITLPPFVNDYDSLMTNGDYLRMAQLEVLEKPSRFIQLVKAYDIDVAATIFYAADMTSHRFWREAYPDQFEGEAPPSDPSYASAIRDAMRGIDKAIGKIAVTMRPEDSLLIVSDHGFQAAESPRTVWVTNFRDMAARAGLRDGEDFSIQTQFGVLILRVHPGAFAEREATLDRLLELVGSVRSKDGTELLPANLLDVAERPAGSERSLLDRARQWVTRLVVSYWFGVEIEPNAHAYVFSFPAGSELESLWPDQSIEVAGQERSVSAAFSRQGFTGEHDPTAIAIAYGGPITKRVERGKLSVLDVAPLLHYLAGSPIPDDLEGQVPKGWIKGAHLMANPVQILKAEQFPKLPSAAEMGVGPAGLELTEKLRALGYVE